MKMKKVKRILSFFLCFIMLFCVAPSQVVNAADTETGDITVIACSDFQNPSGDTAGKLVVENILDAMKSNGVTKADGFFCCGDYSYTFPTTSVSGINALKEAVQDVVTENMVFVQGNHDAATGMNPSGNNDPDSGAYGVFTINEDDYMWYNSDEATIKQTAQDLIEYLNVKLKAEYDKPIFIVSHLPLHYSMRTRNDGDGKYAKYIFDVLNEAGQKGLNIIFMAGHDHSNGWDDYLGGSSYFLPKGNKIKIAQMSKTEFSEETLNFTYMNAGYVGYYNNHNGADDELTMSVFNITADSVVIERYDSEGLHNLKSSGVTNAYKGEGSYYSPNTDVYTSPQTVELTKVTDTTPIKDLIEVQTDGKKYDRITDVSQLEDGGQYLLIYSNYIMVPESVEKANASGSIRVGFDLTGTTAFTGATAYGDYTQYEWTLTKSGDNWLLGDGEKYVKFTSTSSKGVTATLEEEGDLFTIDGTVKAFTFEGESYVLNYNSRGVINGYHDSPAKFSIYTHNCVFDQQIVTDEACKCEADCENAAVYYMSCTCGEVSTNDTDTFSYGTAKGHTASEWKSDADGHWTECEVAECGAIVDSKAAHEYGDDNICDICEYTSENQENGKKYERITDISQLEEGGEYLLIYSDQIMIPESVEKANASGSIRVGFDLVETDAFSEDIAYGDYVQYEWTLTKSGDNWLLGNGEKYVKFTDTSNKGVTATLEEEGDILTINGTANAYTFEGETYVLNYNVRGVINGYKEKPAKFSIYKHNCAFDQNVVIDEAYKKGADCENAAIYYMSCTCGKISTNEADVFTYGEALGHDWAEASCTEPATCKRCDSTEGTALGHDWTEASCTEPATCKRCDSTEGTANGHVISGWKSDKDGHWTECETVGCGTIISSKENHKYGDDNICDTCGYTIKVTPTTDPTEGTNNTGGIGNTNNNDNISGTGTVVSTGDNNTIWMWIALLAVSSVGTVSLLVKRRQKL